MFFRRAIQAGASEKVVRWFLDNNADPNAYAKKYKVTPLSRAVQYAPLSIIKLLLDHGGSAKKGELIHFACRRPVGDPATLTILKLLYDRGAPIDNVLYGAYPELLDVSIFNGTPLWDSCGNGNTVAVRFLLDHGASPNSKPPSLVSSPLEEARKCGNLQIVKMLEKARR